MFYLNLRLGREKTRGYKPPTSLTALRSFGFHLMRQQSFKKHRDFCSFIWNCAPPPPPSSYMWSPPVLPSMTEQSPDRSDGGKVWISEVDCHHRGPPGKKSNRLQRSWDEDPPVLHPQNTDKHLRRHTKALNAAFRTISCSFLIRLNWILLWRRMWKAGIWFSLFSFSIYVIFFLFQSRYLADLSSILSQFYVLYHQVSPTHQL